MSKLLTLLLVQVSMLMLFIGNTEAQSSSSIEALIARLPSTPYVIENIKAPSDYNKEAIEALIRKNYLMSPNLVTIKPEQIDSLKLITNQIGKEIIKSDRIISNELSNYDNLLTKITSNEKIEPILNQINILKQQSDSTRKENLFSIQESYYQTYFCLVKVKNYHDSSSLPRYQADCLKAIDNDVIEKGIGVFVESKSNTKNKELIYDSLKTIIKGSMIDKSVKIKANQLTHTIRVGFVLSVKIIDFIENGTNTILEDLEKLRQHKQWFVFTDKPVWSNQLSDESQTIKDQFGDTLTAEDIQFIESCEFDYESVNNENEDKKRDLNERLINLANNLKGNNEKIKLYETELTLKVKNLKDAISNIKQVIMPLGDSIVPLDIIESAKKHLKQKKDLSTKKKTITESQNIIITKSSPIEVPITKSPHEDISATLPNHIEQVASSNIQKNMQETTTVKDGITEQYNSKYFDKKTVALDKIWFYFDMKADHTDAYILLKNRTMESYSEDDLESDLEKKDRLEKIEKENQLKLQQIAKREAFLQDSTMKVEKNREDSIAKVAAWNDAWHGVSKDSIYIFHDFYKEYNSNTYKYLYTNLASRIQCSKVDALELFVIHPTRGNYTIRLIKNNDSFTGFETALNLKVVVRWNRNLITDKYILAVELSDIR